MDEIAQDIRILNSKLLIPRIADTLKRERLHPLFPEIREKRITTVVAGAGYGKTTLVAQACECLDVNTVWYRLDASDKDFSTFIQYLIAGIRRHYPDIGKETLHRINAAQILGREIEAVLTVLLSEIEASVKKEMVIVLDDYHLIHESSEINDTLNFLIDRIPRLIHMVIVSRFAPRIQLSLYRSRRDALDIREEDLAFSVPEIHQLYLQLFNIPLHRQNLESLFKKTDGWVSGLILFYHSFRGKSPAEIDELLFKLKGSPKVVFNYLEENVYDLLPNEIMNFLTKTAILSRLNIDFCNRFLEIDNSRDILTYLEEKHLFSYPFDEDRQWYYYHHLFQEFLQKKLHQEFGGEAARRLHLNAAGLWEEIGEQEEAMHHYLKARQIDKACELLGSMGRRKLLKENRLQLINSYLQEIPDNHAEANPWVQFTRARVLELSGKPLQAIIAYRKAHDIFEAAGFKKGIGKCLKGLASNYFMIGDFFRAEKMLAEVLKQVETIPRFRLDILGYLIFVSSHLGKMRLADKYYEEALSVSESNETIFHVWLRFNQGFRYGCAGDFALARKMGEQILPKSEEIGFHQLRAMIFHLLAWSSFYLGAFSEGITYAQEGLRVIAGKGIYDSAEAWLSMSLALNATALGMTSEAIAYGEKSLSIFNDLEIRWGQAYANHALQYAHQQSGDLSAAEACSRAALETVRGLDLPLDEGYIKCGLADVLLEKGRIDEAGPLLEDAVKQLEASKLNLCRALLQHARFYWSQNQRKTALNKLMSGLSISESNHYDFWVVHEKRWIIPLLVELYGQGCKTPYISRLLKEFGIYAVPHLKTIQQSNAAETQKAVSALLDELSKLPSPGLRVYCFGKFRLFRGEEEIAAEEWASEKAKMLFKYLVVEKSRGYQHKDMLMELLWPEEDPEVTGNRLRVALTAIRKTLEPELVRGSPSSYLDRRGEAYILDVGDAGWSDVEEFQKTWQHAKAEKNPAARIGHYEKAAALYQGDLLEEDPYCQWCFDAREAYREKYLDILTALIDHCDEKGDYHKAVEYARSYLNSDKCAETIYQQLMRFYRLLGNRAMVAKTFEQCRKHLAEGLDCQPGDETESLYHHLLSI